MIEAELHDGTVLEFPDGTADAVIERVVKEQLGLQGTAEDTGVPSPSTVAPSGAPTVQPGVDPGVGEEFVAPTPREGLPGATAGFGSRPAFTGAGALAGLAAAAPGAPLLGAAAPLALLAGGVLGAAGGSLLFDTMDDVVRFFEGTPKERGPLGPTIRAAEEAKMELLFSGGALSLGPVIRTFKPFIGRALGLKDKARLADLAEAQGVKIGTIQATKSLLVKGFSKVIGVFPFINPPLREAAEASGRSLERSFNDLLNTMAPTATITDLGVDLSRAARGRWKGFKRIAASLYKRFDELAENASNPAFIPTENTATTAAKLVEDAASGKIILSTGKVLGGPKGITDPLAEFISGLKDLPETLTVKQIRRLQRELGEATSRARADGFDIKRGVDLKRALERDLNSPRTDLLTEGEGGRIVNSLSRANQFFAESIKKFETATAKRFAKEDKSIFQPGFFKAGSLNADEIAKDVFNARSPQALKDLRNIVGNNQFKRVARKHVDDIFKGSFEEGVEGTVKFNVNSFTKKLGLDTPAGRQSAEEIVRGTGVTLKDLDQFVEVARAAGDFTISSSSTFLQRKFTLTGFRSILGGTAAFTAALADPLTTVTAILLLRHGGRILTRPSTLKNLTRAMDDTLTKQQRRTAITRVAQLTLRAGGDDE